MVKLKYKIVHGFNAEQATPIDENELEKAYRLFLSGTGRAIFRSGAVDSKYIHAIQPDYHAMMGWNEGHKLGADDFAEIARYGIDARAREFQEQVQLYAERLLNNDDTYGNQNRIGNGN